MVRSQNLLQVLMSVRIRETTSESVCGTANAVDSNSFISHQTRTTILFATTNAVFHGYLDHVSKMLPNESSVPLLSSDHFQVLTPWHFPAIYPPSALDKGTYVRQICRTLVEPSSQFSPF